MDETRLLFSAPSNSVCSNYARDGANSLCPLPLLTGQAALLDRLGPSAPGEGSPLPWQPLWPLAQLRQRYTLGIGKDVQRIIITQLFLVLFFTSSELHRPCHLYSGHCLLQISSRCSTTDLLQEKRVWLHNDAPGSCLLMCPSGDLYQESVSFLLPSLSSAKDQAQNPQTGAFVLQQVCGRICPPRHFVIVPTVSSIQCSGLAGEYLILILELVYVHPAEMFSSCIPPTHCQVTYTQACFCICQNIMQKGIRISIFPLVVLSCCALINAQTKMTSKCDHEITPGLPIHVFFINTHPTCLPVTCKIQI